MTYIRTNTDLGTQVSADPGAATARRDIAIEHRQIRSVLAELQGIRELEELAPRLAALRTLLERHFDREEAPGGLHGAVDATAPRLAPSVRALFDEHRELLDRLDGLVARTRACIDGPMAEVRLGVADLCHRLHAHEAVETDLLAGALYEDIGDGD